MSTWPWVLCLLLRPAQGQPQGGLRVRQHWFWSSHTRQTQYFYYYYYYFFFQQCGRKSLPPGSHPWGCKCWGRCWGWSLGSCAAPSWCLPRDAQAREAVGGCSLSCCRDIFHGLFLPLLSVPVLAARCLLTSWEAVGWLAIKSAQESCPEFELHFYLFLFYIPSFNYTFSHTKEHSFISTSLGWFGL